MSSFPFIQPRKTLGPSQHSVDAPLPPRRKSSLACTSCRAKKSRCDGHKPFCSTCIKNHQRCVYDNSDGRKTHAWKTAIKDLEHKNEHLETILGSLKGGSFDEAVHRLRQLREVGRSGSSSDEAANEPERSPSKPSDSGSGSSDETLPQKSVSPESVDLGEIDLPPEDVTRHAMTAFFSCGGTLFYIMPQESCNDMCSQVYQKKANVAPMMVGQLCALALIGGHYCTDEIPASAMEKYFHHSSSLLKDKSVRDDVGMMRIHACLSMCLVMLKSTSARTMVLSGLTIARSNMQWYSNRSEPGFLDRARVLRTLAFIECWLSGTLGYKLDLKPGEIDVVNQLGALEAETNPFSELNRSLVQAHVFKIACLSAQTFESIRVKAHPCMDDLAQLSAQLDTWLWELPECMRLGSLTSTDSNFDAAKRPILFCHIIHVTSQVTLYERVMLAVLKRAVDPADELVAREVFRLPAEIHQMYGSFAQQLARMIRLLYEENCILTRCWLTIHACYHAHLLLMLSAAQHLALNEDRGLVLEDLSHAEVCLLAVKVSEDHDIAAMRLIDIVSPLYQRLVQTVEDPNAGQLNATYALDGKAKIATRFAHIVHQTVAAMGLPYQEIWV